MAKSTDNITAATREVERAELVVKARQKAAGDMVDRRRQLSEDTAAAESALAGLAGGAGDAFDGEADRVARLRARLQALDDVALPAAVTDARQAEADLFEAQRALAYARAERQADEAAAELVARLPGLIEDVSALQGRLAAAAAAVAAANSDLPIGAVPLLEAEGRVRDQAPLPERLLAEERIELWCFSSTGVALNPSQADRVQPQTGGKGLLPFTGAGQASRPGANVERRAFWRREVLPSQAWRKGPRLTEVEIGPMTMAIAETAVVYFQPIETDEEPAGE